MKRKILFSTLGAIMAIQANASPTSHNFSSMTKQADIVFQGTVISVDYKSSSSNKNQKAMPHTFVTYKIEDVLYGNADGSELTLRFLGGPDKNGNVMLMSNTPRFDKGDQDLLFVQGNGSSECPLIDCAGGRYRIINNAMYTEFGEPILKTKDGKLLSGKSHHLEDVSTFMIGDKQFKRVKNNHKIYEGDGNASNLTSKNRSGHHLNISSFVNNLRLDISRSSTKDPQGTSKHVTPVDIKKPFSFHNSKAVKLPEPVVKTSHTKPKNKQEENEMIAIQKNDGNPVIK